MSDKGKILSIRLVGAADVNWPRDLVVGRRMDLGRGIEDELLEIQQVAPAVFRLILKGGQVLDLVNCGMAVLRESAPAKDDPVEEMAPAEQTEFAAAIAADAREPELQPPHTFKPDDWVQHEGATEVYRVHSPEQHKALGGHLAPDPQSQWVYGTRSDGKLIAGPGHGFHLWPAVGGSVVDNQTGAVVQVTAVFRKDFGLEVRGPDGQPYALFLSDIQPPDWAWEGPKESEPGGKPEPEGHFEVAPVVSVAQEPEPAAAYICKPDDWVKDAETGEWKPPKPEPEPAPEPEKPEKEPSRKPSTTASKKAAGSGRKPSPKGASSGSAS